MNIFDLPCYKIRDHVPTAPGAGALAIRHRTLPSVGTCILFHNKTLGNIESHWENKYGCDAWGHRIKPYTTNGKLRLQTITAWVKCNRF